MLNQINVIGNIGRIETKDTSTGKKVSKFSLAVSERFKDKDETLWLEVSAWDKLAENCEKYLSKGKKVYVSGKLKSREYTGKDGTKKGAYEVQARDVVFLSPKEGGEQAPEPAKAQISFEDSSMDSIPF